MGFEQTPLEKRADGYAEIVSHPKDRAATASFYEAGADAERRRFREGILALVEKHKSHLIPSEDIQKLINEEE